jgi:hypothetical protein
LLFRFSRAAAPSFSFVRRSPSRLFSLFLLKLTTRRLVKVDINPLQLEVRVTLVGAYARGGEEEEA